MASVVLVVVPGRVVESGGEFVPLAAPVRLLDTRPGSSTVDGEFAGIGLRSAGSTLQLDVAGRAGLPVDAASVVLNVTAVDAVGWGYVTVHPSGSVRPNASNVNYDTGQTIANTVITPVGADGDVVLFTHAATHLLVDAVGYLPADAFDALPAAARLLDTRPGSATVDGNFAGIGLRAAGSTIELDVAGRAGIPADATSVVLNVTATSPEGWGFLTVHPTGTARPNASNLNYDYADTIANTVVTTVGAGGRVSIYTYAASHLIVDVSGHLPADSFTPLAAPARILDTRIGSGTIDGQQSSIGLRTGSSSVQVDVAGRAGLPENASSVVLNVTAVDALGWGFVTEFPTGNARPNASNLNYDTGTTIANTVVARLGAGGDVCIYTYGATHLIVDVIGHLPGPPPPPEGPTCPPGTRSIAYLSHGDVWLMDADGAHQRPLELGIVVDDGPVWSPDGMNLAFTGFDRKVPAPMGAVFDIWVVDANRSGLRNVTNLPGPDFALSPSWSPDGRQLAYVTTAWDVWIVDADGTDNRRITNDATWQEEVWWSPDGSLLVYTARELIDVQMSNSPEIWTMEPDGTNATHVPEPGILAGPDRSPDGSEIAFDEYDPSYTYSDIWIMDVDSSQLRNLTDDPTRFDRSPTWSPDGTQIAFVSEGLPVPFFHDDTGEIDCCVPDPPPNIYVMSADGGAKTQLTIGIWTQGSPSWQPLPAG